MGHGGCQLQLHHLADQQAQGPTGRDIGVVAVRENIDTSEGSAAAKFFRRSMLAQGGYQVDSASERIKATTMVSPG